MELLLLLMRVSAALCPACKLGILRGPRQFDTGFDCYVARCHFCGIFDDTVEQSGPWEDGDPAEKLYHYR